VASESFLRGLFKEGIFTLIIKGVEWLVLIGSPIVVAAMTVAAGILQGTPIAYVIAAAAVAAAGTVTWLLRFEDWRIRRTPAGKLGFAQALIAFDYARDAEGKVTSVNRGQFILIFINNANFPISYVVDNLEISINEKVNLEGKQIKRGVVESTAVLQYRPYPIDLNIEKKHTIEGRAKFNFRDGRLGKERFPLSKNLNVICQFDDKTLYSQQLTHDVPE
jgi:hypothetical protein